MEFFKKRFRKFHWTSVNSSTESFNFKVISNPRSIENTGIKWIPMNPLTQNHFVGFGKKKFCYHSHWSWNIPTPKLQFTDTENAIFSGIKSNLIKLATLFYPDSDVTQYKYTARATLHRLIDVKLVPMNFFSNKLSENQRKWSTVAYLLVLHLKPQMQKRHVTLVIDHKPLSLAFHKNETNELAPKRKRTKSTILTHLWFWRYVAVKSVKWDLQK